MTLRRRDHDVLHPHPELAGEINAWLDAEAVAWLEDDFAAADDERLFVDVHPKAVPGAMHKILPKACLGDNAPRGGINRPAGDARLTRHSSRHVGAIDDVVDLLRLLRCLANRDRPGDVAVVAADLAAEIHDQHVAILQNGVVGEVMRLRRIRPGSDNRKRGVAAALSHRIGQEFGNLLLGLACFDLGEHRKKRLVSDVACL